MEVLQEGDPGLKKKRAKLREFVAEPGKPVLSQVCNQALVCLYNLLGFFTLNEVN